jgi:hypothetical protein
LSTSQANHALIRHVFPYAKWKNAVRGVYTTKDLFVGREPRGIRKIPKSVAGKAQAPRGNAAIASADWNSRNSRHPRKSEGKLGEQPSNFEKRGYPTKAIVNL